MLTACISGRGDRDGSTYSSLDSLAEWMENSRDLGVIEGCSDQLLLSPQPLWILRSGTNEPLNLSPSNFFRFCFSPYHVQVLSTPLLFSSLLAAHLDLGLPVAQPQVIKVYCLSFSFNILRSFSPPPEGEGLSLWPGPPLPMWLKSWLWKNVIKGKKDRKAEIEWRMLWKMFKELLTIVDICHDGWTFGLIYVLLNL